MQGARKALLDAFSELALSRRYADFNVALIASRARVAKSTFYYHFREKDDLLVENLRPLITALAELAVSPEPTPEARYWVAHLWEHRAQARRLFTNSIARKLHQALTDGVQARLASSPGDKAASMVAHQVAGSMAGLIQAWVAGRVSGGSEDMVRRLWRGARALVASTLGEDLPAQAG